MKKDGKKLPSQSNKLRLPTDDQALALPAPRATRTPSDEIAAARGALFIEKRREARYPTNDPAHVEIMQGENKTIAATVLDVSRSGLRVSLAVSIPRGVEVKVTLQRNVVIFGQIRYSRPFEDGFEAGVLIQDMSQNSGQSSTHIEDDLLSLYVIGKGLTVPEVIKLKEHLVNCESCRIRLGEKDALINPVRTRKILATPDEAPRDPADD